MKNPLTDELYKKRKIPKDHPVRGEYFRDQTAIIHCMPFRRLKHKTQVFFSPENDHVCTRIEHVMHVASIAASICKGLNTAKGEWHLDTELAYAIGLGHDLGHAPFGHAGEEALNNILASDSRRFIHEINSLRVVDSIANDGQGLNLTFAVRDGIVCHNGEKFEQTLKPIKDQRDPSEVIDRNCTPTTYEGCIVRFSDKIAYLGRDIEDAVVAGFIKSSDIPAKVKTEIGSSNGEIINALVLDLIETSKDKDEICFSDEKFSLLTDLNKFNTDHIYNHSIIRRYKKFGQSIVHELFDYLCKLYCTLGKNYEAYKAEERVRLDKDFGQYLKKMDDFYMNESYIPQAIVADYVAGMSDSYALECMRQISIPEPIRFQKIY